MRNELYGPAPAGALPVTQAIAVTTETAINNPVPNAVGATIPLLVIIPSGTILDGRAFELVASGVITTGAASTVTAKLYAVPSAVVAAGTAGTLGNDTAIASSGAVTQNSAAAPFQVRAKLIFDSVTGKLTGSSTFSINNSLVAEAALSAVATGLTSANDPVVGFLITFTLSGGSGSIKVNDFNVDF